VNILVDTSVWSLALRRSPHDLSAAEQESVRELGDVVGEGRARIIGIVRQELLSGIRHIPQFEKLRETLRSFPDEAVSTTDHEEAARISNQCRAKGLAVSAADMLICAVARSRQWAIFTTDPDFAGYAKVLTLRLHMVRK
jgi:predicted nucleic acid-binding protein